MSDHVVLADLADGVLTLTLNRPERNNAYTVEMEHRYFDLLDEAAEDPAVRVIVLTGAGRTFCPGLDIEILEAGIEAGSLATDRPRRPQTHPLRIPKPVVAAINGACPHPSRKVRRSFGARPMLSVWTKG